MTDILADTERKGDGERPEHVTDEAHAFTARGEGRFVLISFTAWLMALGGFTHAIAGMVEIAVLVFAGEVSFAHGLLTLALPTLAGNVLGGTGLFAPLAHAQVKDEL